MSKIMSFIKGEQPKEQTTTVLGAGVQKTKMQKIEFNIRRFTLALEQCEKGPERRAELQRNLNYWTALKAAEEALEGLN